MKESNHHLTYSGHAGKNVLLFLSFPGQLDNILLWHGYVVVAESVTLSGKEALSTTTNHQSNLERQETSGDWTRRRRRNHDKNRIIRIRTFQNSAHFSTYLNVNLKYPITAQNALFLRINCINYFITITTTTNSHHLRLCYDNLQCQTGRLCWTVSQQLLSVLCGNFFLLAVLPCITIKHSLFTSLVTKYVIYTRLEYNPCTERPPVSSRPLLLYSCAHFIILDKQLTNCDQSWPIPKH